MLSVIRYCIISEMMLILLVNYTEEIERRWINMKYINMYYFSIQSIFIEEILLFSFSKVIKLNLLEKIFNSFKIC